MKKSYFILNCGILNTAALFGNALNAFGLQYAFFIVPIFYFIFGILLLKANPFKNKKTGMLLIFVPYPILLIGTFIYSFFTEGFIGQPLTIALIISIILALIVYNKSKKIIVRYGISFILLLSVATALLPNYYNYRVSESNNPILDKKLPNLNVYNQAGEKIDLSDLKGKVIILDVWNSSCSVCISQFPKFNSLAQKYINDDIKFFSLNIPLERDKKNKIIQYTEPYSFGKLYADDNVSKQLNLDSFPKYIFIDKNMNVRYIGRLNTGTFDFYKNFDNLVNDLKNEK